MTAGIDPFTGLPLPYPPQWYVIAGTPISNLPLAAALTGAELIPMLQNGTTVAALLSNFPEGGGGGMPTNPIQPVGAASIFAGPSVTVTTGLRQIVAARPGNPGTGRVSVTVQNNGFVTANIGDNTISSNIGWPLQPGEAATFPTTAALFAITASGSTVIAVFEVF